MFVEVNPEEFRRLAAHLIDMTACELKEVYITMNEGDIAQAKTALIEIIDRCCIRNLLNAESLGGEFALFQEQRNTGNAPGPVNLLTLCGLSRLMDITYNHRTEIQR